MEADAKPIAELPCRSEDKPEIKTIELPDVSISCTSSKKVIVKDILPRLLCEGTRDNSWFIHHPQDAQAQPPPPRKLSGWSALLKGGEQAKANDKDSTQTASKPAAAETGNVALSIVVAGKDSDVKAVLQVALAAQQVLSSKEQTHDSATSSEIATSNQQTCSASLPDMNVDKECREVVRVVEAFGNTTSSHVFGLGPIFFADQSSSTFKACMEKGKKVQ
jgi:hypothetical protein